MLHASVRRVLAGFAFAAFTAQTVAGTIVNDAQGKTFAQGIGSLPYLKGVDVEGNPVRFVQADDLPVAYQDALHKMQGGGALKFSAEGVSLCAVSVQQEGSHGMINRHYIINSPEPSENTFMQANVHDFYIAAHELSHCFNHGSQDSVKQIRQLLTVPALAKHAKEIEQLEMSIRETYADLSAVLLGASKTGDWSVFVYGVMPYRAGPPDASHVTLNAISTIISKLDPKLIQGLTFSEVNVIANDLFQSAFMTKDHAIDLNSPGVGRILEEMDFLSDRLLVMTELPYADDTAKASLREKSTSMHQFVRTLRVGGAKDVDGMAFLTALQVVDARLQSRLAADTKFLDAENEYMIDEIEQGLLFRENFSTQAFGKIARIADPKDVLGKQIAIVERWVNVSTSVEARAALANKLDDLLAENLGGKLDPSTFDERMAISASIQTKLKAARAVRAVAAKGLSRSQAPAATVASHEVSFGL